MEKDLNPLEALDEIRLVHKDDNGLQRRADIIEKALKDAEKDKKTLKEILALYSDWLGDNKLSDFAFFTLLNDIVCKYDLKEALL